jgi:hypothetical protein
MLADLIDRVGNRAMCLGCLLETLVVALRTCFSLISMRMSARIVF